MSENEKNLTIADEQLMELSANGDRKAFYILVKRWNKSIINFFYRNIGNQEIAEELAQDVFLSIWKATNYKQKSSFYCWIYKIARNKLIDFYRKHKIQSVPIEENIQILETEKFNRLEDKLIQKEEIQMVRDTINKLSEEQKLILILSKYQKLAYEDIAKVLDCSKENVKVKVFRAINAFVKKFKELYGN